LSRGHHERRTKLSKDNAGPPKKLSKDRREAFLMISGEIQKIMRP